MSRSEILWRLRQALRNHPEASLPDERPSLPTFDDPIDVFTRRLEEAGGVVLDARRLGIQECLRRVLEETGSTQIFWEEPDVFRENGIAHRIRDGAAFENDDLVFSSHPRGILTLPMVLNARPLALRHVESATLSAGSARLAIAETGSIVFCSGKRRIRLLLGLAPNRITFLAVNRIVMNAQEAVTRGLPLKTSSLVTWISGPSQTGDIEATLVRGVHGPGGWYVILTDPPGHRTGSSRDNPD